MPARALPPYALRRFGDIDARFGVFELQRRLRFGVLLRADLLSFLPPIEDVPVDLKAHAADAVREHAAVIDRSQPKQREADVRNSLGVCEATFELRFMLLHFRQTNLRA